MEQCVGEPSGVSRRVSGRINTRVGEPSGVSRRVSGRVLTRPLTGLGSPESRLFLKLWEPEKKWEGERRGVSPPCASFHGGLTPRRSPPQLFLTL